MIISVANLVVAGICFGIAYYEYVGYVPDRGVVFTFIVLGLINLVVGLIHFV